MIQSDGHYITRINSLEKRVRASEQTIEVLKFLMMNLHPSEYEHATQLLEKARLERIEKEKKND